MQAWIQTMRDLPGPRPARVGLKVGCTYIWSSGVCGDGPVSQWQEASGRRQVAGGSGRLAVNTMPSGKCLGADMPAAPVPWYYLQTMDLLCGGWVQSPARQPKIGGNESVGSQVPADRG